MFHADTLLTAAAQSDSDGLPNLLDESDNVLPDLLDDDDASSFQTPQRHLMRTVRRSRSDSAASPSSRRKKKKTSWIWKYVCEDANQPTRVRCVAEPDRCTLLINYSSQNTTVAIRHLRDEHDHKLLPEERLTVQPAQINWTKQQLRYFHAQITLAIVFANLSFHSICENPHLQNAVSIAGLSIPAKSTVHSRLQCMEIDIHHAMIKAFTAIQYVAMTTDATFLTPKQAPYVGVTCHFIDSNWQKRCGILAAEETQQSQTAIVIEAVIKRAIDSFQLHGKVAAIVTDQGKNFTNATSALLHDRKIDLATTCGCHKLSLVMKKPSKKEANAQIASCIAKCQRLVKTFKNGWSQLKRDVFKQEQRQLIFDTQQRVSAAAAIQKEVDELRQELEDDTNADQLNFEDFDVGRENVDEDAIDYVEELRALVDNMARQTSLILDVATRWNSCVKMIHRLLLWYPAVAKVLAMETFKPKLKENEVEADYILSDAEINILKQYCEIADLMMTATLQLEGDGVTSSLVLYSICKVWIWLSNRKRYPQCIIQLRNDIY